MFERFVTVYSFDIHRTENLVIVGLVARTRRYMLRIRCGLTRFLQSGDGEVWLEDRHCIGAYEDLHKQRS